MQMQLRIMPSGSGCTQAEIRPFEGNIRGTLYTEPVNTFYKYFYIPLFTQVIYFAHLFLLDQARITQGRTIDQLGAELSPKLSTAFEYCHIISEYPAKKSRH
jgi:hypothetical protein